MAETVDKSFHDSELLKCRTQNEAQKKESDTKLGDFKKTLVEIYSDLERQKTDFISDADNQIIKKLSALETMSETNLNIYNRINSFIEDETLSGEEYVKIKARQTPVSS